MIINPDIKPHPAVLPIIVLLCIAVAALDALTPLGITTWVFYLAPLLLCTLQRNPLLPYWVAAGSVVFIISDYFIAPSGLSQQTSAVNRFFGIITILGVAYLTSRILTQREKYARLLWLEQGRAAVSRSMMGEKTVAQIADNMLHALANYMGAQVGTLYRLDKDKLIPAGSFARTPLPAQSSAIPLGQGVAGEVARSGETSVLNDVPDNYLPISGGTGSAAPRHVLVFPIMADERVQGVVELGFLRKTGDFTEEIELSHLVTEKLGMALRSALYREHLHDLLEETRRQSEELQTQQEELRVTNEELQEQSRTLQESQSTLETQQSELEQANVQLEERTQLLEQQKRTLIRTQQQMEAAAQELEKANRYKSEFLANMSHELRTPLNSSLILSHMLADNKAGNLTPDQVRYARTIHSANQDLLTLINDILDLSKIEAGQVEMQFEPVRLTELLDSVKQTFEPVAHEKQLGFQVMVAPGSPAMLTTDAQRVQQVLKNLLSNAFKFTAKGQVSLEVAPGENGRVLLAVKDTGIGIAPEKQDIIFQAFQQADGSTSRTYGGTGLGLSISRQLAHLLGGAIRVASTHGSGSTFTLELPAQPPKAKPAEGKQDEFIVIPPQPAPNQARPVVAAPALAHAAEADTNVADEIDMQPENQLFKRQYDRAILVVEDDEKFAGILSDLVRDMHFDCLHAATARTAIHLVQQHKPDAVLLDVGLPDQSGLSVLEHIKRHSDTRHIPVHMISVVDHEQTALAMGALGYVVKPAARDEIVSAIARIEERLARKANQILVVEDDATLRESLSQMLGGDNTVITAAATAAEALQHLAQSTFDCMVMDLMLPDESGYELLEKMAKSGKHAFPPVIIYTGRVLSREEEQRLRRYSQSIIIKGAKSPERLLDEVSLFLHRVETALPAEQQRMLMQARERDGGFEGRRILLVEDDVRNIFALSSLFEPLGVNLDIARNGKEALARLSQEPGIDLVLMDLMMPEMDGLTAMREIRKQAQFKNLPIIALTAKAMANDRKESIEAGANDYIAKPIDVEKLVSLCRVWLPK